MPIRFPHPSTGLAATLATALLLAACATASPDATPAAPSTAVLAAIADPSRPAADSDRDAQRMPAALLAFSGVKPGDRVADLMPGGGYFTRLFAAAVGPRGKVVAVLPAEFAASYPKSKVAVEGLAASAPLGNVTALVAPAARIAPPEPLDIVWTAQNYHDVYYGFGADAASALDSAVFAALKPGGVYVVIDHVANAGLATADVTALHRIDPALVKAQVTSAGFRYVGETTVLRNPGDPHDAKVFDPSIRGRTDQFAYKFVKPTS